MLETLIKPRRWFQRFSLRTLFVGTAVLGCWLAWEMHLIHERQEMRQWITDHFGSVVDEDSGWRSPVRLLMGDFAPEFIAFSNRELTVEEREEIERVFPGTPIMITYGPRLDTPTIEPDPD